MTLRRLSAFSAAALLLLACNSLGDGRGEGGSGERKDCIELGCSGGSSVRFDLTGIVPEGSVMPEGRLSFRMTLSEGFTGDIVIDRIAGVVREVRVDGEPVDIEVSASSHTLSVVKGSSDFLEHQTLRLGAELLAPGEWHDVDITFAALCHASPLVFDICSNSPGNSASICGIEFCRTSSGTLPPAVTPTDRLAPEGEDCSGLRLTTGAVNGLSALRYTWCANYGMEYIDLTLASTSIFTVEDFTDASGKTRKGHGYYISRAAPLLESAGLKVWCIHMPYLDNLCLAHTDETLRGRAVERFISYMKAVKVLHPVNVLFHAGANSADSEAYSSEALLRSLLELQPHADAIGAHICIENIWKGVGSDPQELCAVVDEANLQGKPLKQTRIAFDSGHALLWCRLNGGTPCDYLKTLGPRVGTLHISSNHGNNDDHVFPGYGTAEGYGSGTATWSELMAPYWGELYSILLKDCRYRGPWVYEVGTKDFDDGSQGPKRFYTLGTPWFWTFNHDSYIYPAYLKFLSGQQE